MCFKFIHTPILHIFPIFFSSSHTSLLNLSTHNPSLPLHTPILSLYIPLYLPHITHTQHHPYPNPHIIHISHISTTTINIHQYPLISIPHSSYSLPLSHIIFHPHIQYIFLSHHTISPIHHSNPTHTPLTHL